MYDVAGRPRPGLVPPAGPGDVRRDGAGRHQRRRRVPLPPPRARRRAVRRSPNAMGEALIAAAGGGRAAHHAARHVLPARRHRRRARRRHSAGSPTATPLAWAARADRARATAHGVRIGAAIHSVRAVDPASDRRGRRRVGRRAAVRRCTPTCPSSRPRTSSALAAHGRTPTELLADARRARPSGSRPSTPRTSPDGDVGAARRARCWCCLCPTTERDLADGIGLGVAAARRRRPTDARQRLARRHRPARGGPRRRARRAAGDRRPWQPRRAVAAARWRRRTATPASAGPTPGGSRPARSPT